MSLKVGVTTPSTQFAKLHSPQHGTNDEFKPLVYVGIIVFSVAHFFLYVVSALTQQRGIARTKSQAAPLMETQEEDIVAVEERHVAELDLFTGIVSLAEEK